MRKSKQKEAHLSLEARRSGFFVVVLVKEIIHPKIKILPPSYQSKPVRMSFFCGTQKKIFIVKLHGNYTMCSAEERKSKRFGTT